MEKRCEKCNAYKDLENDFYWRYSDNRNTLKISKYCKECNKKNIENIQNKFELNSCILNICEQIDAPFIKEAWDRIINKYKTPQATIGRYIALMRLTSYQNYKFKDSIYCNLELWPINVKE